MKKIIAGLLVLYCFTANAQKFAGSLNFQLGLPQGEYKEVNGRTGVGGRFNFLFSPAPQVPVSFGLEVGYQLIGTQSSRFSSNVYGFYDEYRLTASNNIFSVLINARVSPVKPGSFIRPFADGMFGWNDFFSTVSLERETYFNNNGAQSNSSKSRWSTAHGASLGVDVRLDKRGRTYLELKTSYLIGNKTRYLTDPQIYNDGSVTFTEKQSETNMIIPQVGVHFTF